VIKLGLDRQLVCQRKEQNGWNGIGHPLTAPSYKLGDKVWLNAQNMTTAHLMKKLDQKWLVPYSINKVVSQNAYSLELPVSFG
jgi:hypothetical protein